MCCQEAEVDVTWLEIAVASPCWNSLLVYYVEGDRGHLLDERGHQRKAPLNVRGNAYSFSMPWERIAASLKRVVDQDISWKELPHPPATLAHMVLFSLRIGEVIKKLRATAVFEK